MRGYCGLVLMVLAVTGCGYNRQPPTPLFTTCEAPRPQVCTMEYRPVCAYMLSGGSREYSSGCNACADDAVANYIPGPCHEEGNQ